MYNINLQFHASLGIQRENGKMIQTGEAKIIISFGGVVQNQILLGKEFHCFRFFTHNTTFIAKGEILF